MNITPKKPEEPDPTSKSNRPDHSGDAAAATQQEKPLALRDINVVLAHLDAVRSGDPLAMARDYAPDALLERPGARYCGQEAIAAYFLTVGPRLAGGTVEFVQVDAERLQVHWRIIGGLGHGSRGIDQYTVRDGCIVHQSVALIGSDF